MKRSFKGLSVVCIIVMLIPCLMNNTLLGNNGCLKKVFAMEYHEEIELGTLKTVTLNHKSEQGREYILKFVPVEDGDYIFYSLSDAATVAYLYIDNSEYAGDIEVSGDSEIPGERKMIASDTGRTGRNENFSLKYELEAGKTYYFGAGYAESGTRSGSFMVGIRKAANETELNTAPQLTVGSAGLEYEISTEGEFVYAQFSPTADSYYNIYSQNVCGHLGVCDGECGCEVPCSCLSAIYMNIYEKNNDGELETLYLADAGTKGGVLLRNYFEKDKNYYIEMSASDCKKTGKFKLYADTKLVNAPVEQLIPGTTVETNICGTQESLVYKIVPEKTANYRFLSNKMSYLYMSLYNNELKEIAQTSIDIDGFDKEVALEEGQTYYFVVNANFVNTVPAVLSVEEIAAEEEKPDEKNPSGGDSPSTGDASTENPSTENPSSTSSDSTSTGVSSEDSHGDGTNFLNLISLDKVDIKTVKNQIYTGKKVFPTVKVSYQGTSLKANEDYIAVYKANKNIGVASIILTGIGNFSGTQKINFKIVPAKVVIRNGKRTGNKLSLKWKKVKGATGYEVTYAYSANFKKAKKMTVKNCKAALKLASAKKCYVKVRALKKVKGKKYFGSMSKTKKY